MLTYTIVLTEEPDGSAVNVSVPALPGVLTWGATHEEAMASAREAIELHLEGYVERDRPFPPDRRPQGKHVFTVEVTPPVSASRRTA